MAKTYEGQVRRKGPRNAAIFSLFDQMLMPRSRLARGDGTTASAFPATSPSTLNSNLLLRLG